MDKPVPARIELLIHNYSEELIVSLVSSGLKEKAGLKNALEIRKSSFDENDAKVINENSIDQKHKIDENKLDVYWD